MIVGNGNVALDVARILTADPDALARTDISDAALAALRTSAVREVVIAARRGPADSAFTLPELIGLTSVADVVLDAEDHELVRRDLATVDDAVTAAKLEILAKLPEASAAAARPRIRLAYKLTPHRIVGVDRATGIEFRRTGTDEPVHLDAGLVLTSIGYRGKPIAGLPFDEAAGVVPNDGRPGDRSGRRKTGGRIVCGGLDQARPHRFHRHEQVVCHADRVAAGRRFQRRPADRSGRAAVVLWRRSSATAGPRSSTRPAGVPSTRPNYAAAKPPAVPG